jgi:phosphatidylserine decarboxylase
MLKKIPKIKSALKTKTTKIEVIDRKTGEKFIEKIYGENAMRLLYGNPVVVSIASRVLANRWLSNIYGAYHDSAASKHKISEFVDMLNIDVKECEKNLADYQSFNDFFTRKLKKEARPINQEKNSVVSPSDGRLLVFPKIEEDTICYLKWAPIKLLDLFNGSEGLVERYKNGSCAVLRLCPADYHRFHFPVSGKTGITKTVPGILHSVNPYALEQKIPVYCLNKRTLCELKSDHFGSVLMMEVGAMFVGTIVQTYRPMMHVEKADEKGFFKFGGSTCIFFFEPDVMNFDEDLVKNSLSGLETLVQMGEKIGKSFS